MTPEQLAQGGGEWLPCSGLGESSGRPGLFGVRADDGPAVSIRAFAPLCSCDSSVDRGKSDAAESSYLGELTALGGLRSFPSNGNGRQSCAQA